MRHIIGKLEQIFSLLQGKMMTSSKHLIFITIPLYFILDAGNKYWGWIPVDATLLIFSGVFLSMVFLYFLLRFFLESHYASIFLIFIIINYLFFKTIRDWLVINSGTKLLVPYRYYFLFLGGFLFLMFFLIRNLPSLKAIRFLFYLNLLFLLLTITELIQAVYNYSTKSAKPFFTNEVRLKELRSHQYPDVYILQLDEYAGLSTLHDDYGIINDKFVEDLEKRSFQVAKNPNSNYNGTPFSVLSLFNMNYIEGVTKKEVASAIAYSRSMAAIEKNYLSRFFADNGYNILNLSFFDIGQATSLDYLFLPVKKRLALDKTFGGVLMNDLFCSINSNKFHLFINDYPARIDCYNQEVIERSFKTITSELNPVFMYAHFMMPHAPYLRNSNGQLKNIGEAYKESNKGLNIKSYEDYLKYCNSISLKIVDSILAKKPHSIIVLLSDHGLRNSKGKNRSFSEFNNFLAVYSPEKPGFKIPDSIGTVNVFRLMLNEYFDQKLPMLENRKINVNMGLRE